MKSVTFTVSPIGSVAVSRGRFRLKLSEEYTPALAELDGFSHVVVLWWCHRLDLAEYRSLTDCDQPYRRSPAKVGIFATRSPARPNPIATTAVAVSKIDRDEGTLHVPYIDAEDGTPILDIKPYHPSTDRIRQVSVPVWCSHWPQWYEDSADFDWEAEFVNAR